MGLIWGDPVLWNFAENRKVSLFWDGTFIFEGGVYPVALPVHDNIFLPPELIES